MNSLATLRLNFSKVLIAFFWANVVVVAVLALSLGQGSAIVAIVGAATALFAATIGLVQTDIKRVLAYSTVSQLGYMMMGLGVGGVAVGMFTPGSPAARANIQKGDILVGVNVGARHWETTRADTVAYTLQQPEVSRSHLLPFYIVRRNNVHQGEMNLATEAAAADRGPTARR